MLMIYVQPLGFTGEGRESVREMSCVGVPVSKLVFLRLFTTQNATYC